MILRFEEDFPGAKIFKLEENYRSTQTILAAANELVDQQRDALRTRRSSRTARPASRSPRSTPSPIAKKRATCSTRSAEHTQEDASFNDILVLYRTNAQSRVFEEALLAQGIPYRVVGGVGFYARAEVKDMLAYLRYILNPSDAVAFRRIINVPRRSIGTQTVNAARRRRGQGRRPDRRGGVRCGLAQARGAEEAARTRALRRADQAICARRRRRSRFRICSIAVMEESGYLREMQADETNDGRARVENLEELVSVAKEFETNPETDVDARRFPRQHRAGERSRHARCRRVVRYADDACTAPRASSFRSCSSPVSKRASFRTCARRPTRPNSKKSGASRTSA